MDRFSNFVSAMHRGEGGQDLLEYALLCALIALVCVGTVTTVGNTINSVLWQVIAAANF
jgi:Flp pilus assembly pilin Flp